MKRLEGRRSTNIEDRRQIKLFFYTDPEKGKRLFGMVPGSPYGPETRRMHLQAVLEDRAAVEKYRRGVVLNVGQPYREDVSRRKLLTRPIHEPKIARFRGDQARRRTSRFVTPLTEMGYPPAKFIK